MLYEYTFLGYTFIEIFQLQITKKDPYPFVTFHYQMKRKKRKKILILFFSRYTSIPITE